MYDTNGSLDCEINKTRMYIIYPFTYDVSYFLCGPLLTTIVFAGLLSNSLCLVIFFGTILRPRIYLYLIALTIWDMLLLISSFLLYSLPVLLYGRVHIFGPYVPVYPLFYTFSNIAHSGSIWTVVVLAMERYFALCRPLRYITWNTEVRAKTLLCTVACLAVLYQVPKFFEIVFLPCVDVESTSRNLIPVMVSSKLRDNQVYKVLYKIMGGMVFFSVGPLLILSILTVRVSLAVKKNFVSQRKQSFNDSAKLTKRLSCESGFKNGTDNKRRSEEREEKRMDLMLIAVMVKFCLCHTLPVVLDLSENITKGEHFQLVFETLVDVSNVLVVANSSCNLAIYCTFGLKFRNSLKAFFAGGNAKMSNTSSACTKSFCSSNGTRSERDSKYFDPCLKTIESSSV